MTGVEKGKERREANGLGLKVSNKNLVGGTGGAGNEAENS